ncbi:hypothetical protein [Sphingobacterium zeae]|uniref:Uncharacterized protein n=1 Tax=Sphingobacterium zeae TaxID=1776859 RepID=A0ABU0UD34_9SPHI|nr:hypothetical protein [Sphingobacterium zeae]MDQ1152764.1 hypothetical protein [Sphingobacterium zeae]
MTIEYRKWIFTGPESGKDGKGTRQMAALRWTGLTDGRGQHTNERSP